jgi:hypothetical protein
MIQTDRHSNSFNGGLRPTPRNSTQSRVPLPAKQGIREYLAELLHAWL